MQNKNRVMVNLIISLMMTTIIVLSSGAFAKPLKPMIDDFSHDANNQLDIPRQFMNDTMVGGGTTTQTDIANGILSITGNIEPPRGQPGWASTVLPLDPQGLPQDASAFEGISLKVKVIAGTLSVSANSSEITNFDYHAALVSVVPDGKFHEVKIPFSSMQRAWSAQTELNTSTLNGLSIVAFSLQKANFAYELDEVSFY